MLANNDKLSTINEVREPLEWIMDGSKLWKHELNTETLPVNDMAVMRWWTTPIPSPSAIFRQVPEKWEETVPGSWEDSGICTTSALQVNHCLWRMRALLASCEYIPATREAEEIKRQVLTERTAPLAFLLDLPPVKYFDQSVNIKQFHKEHLRRILPAIPPLK